MTTLKIAAATAVIAALAGLWLRAEHFAGRARTSEALLSSALAIGNANAALAEAQVNRAKKVDAIASLNAIRKRDLRVQSDIRRKEITDETPEADGPLAPILRDQLDRLPERPGPDPRRDPPAPVDTVIPHDADRRAIPSAHGRHPAGCRARR